MKCIKCTLIQDNKEHSKKKGAIGFEPEISPSTFEYFDHRNSRLEKRESNFFTPDFRNMKSFF